MSSAIYPDPPRLVTAVCGHGEQQRLSNARLRLTFLLFPGYSLARARVGVSVGGGGSAFYNAPVAYCGPGLPRPSSIASTVRDAVAGAVQKSRLPGGLVALAAVGRVGMFIIELLNWLS